MFDFVEAFLKSQEHNRELGQSLLDAERRLFEARSDLSSLLICIEAGSPLTLIKKHAAYLRSKSKGNSLPQPIDAPADAQEAA